MGDGDGGHSLINLFFTPIYFAIFYASSVWLRIHTDRIILDYNLCQSRSLSRNELIRILKVKTKKKKTQ